jgi:hypothetical protein
MDGWMARHRKGRPQARKVPRSESMNSTSEQSNQASERLKGREGGRWSTGRTRMHYNGGEVYD